MAGSQHGVRLEPEQLIEAARAGGRDAGPAHDALRDRRDLLSWTFDLAVSWADRFAFRSGREWVPGVGDRLPDRPARRARPRGTAQPAALVRPARSAPQPERRAGTGSWRSATRWRSPPARQRAVAPARPAIGGRAAPCVQPGGSRRWRPPAATAGIAAGASPCHPSPVGHANRRRSPKRSGTRISVRLPPPRHARSTCRRLDAVADVRCPRQSSASRCRDRGSVVSASGPDLTRATSTPTRSRSTSSQMTTGCPARTT